MKLLGKILALAMIGEGIALCVAQRQYLGMWRNVFGGFEHWFDWFEENSSITRAIAVAELCSGILLLRKLKR